MRKSVCLSTAILLLIVVMAVAVVACGSNTTAGSSTTLSTAGSSSTTAVGETSTTVTGEETTTSVSETGDTTSSSEGDTTASSEEETTSTEATQTADTADHAAELRSDYPSTESFDNSSWATLNADPASHLGAAVDVTGQPANATVDPDSLYLVWTLTVSGTGGEQMTALCRTNVTIDRSLLSSGSPVEVKGLVVAAQGSDAGGGPIIYVESVQKAA